MTQHSLARTGPLQLPSSLLRCELLHMEDRALQPVKLLKIIAVQPVLAIL
jgi:hypothetical protein